MCGILNVKPELGYNWVEKWGVQINHQHYCKGNNTFDNSDYWILGTTITYIEKNYRPLICIFVALFSIEQYIYLIFAHPIVRCSWATSKGALPC